MSPFRVLLVIARSLLKERIELAAENLALRQQVTAVFFPPRCPDGVFGTHSYRSVESRSASALK